MTLTPKTSTHNFYAFLWHAAFLAFAQNFMDVDTIIPAMLIESGGGAMHVGIMAAIMTGGSSFTQLFFAPYISNKAYKKKYLLIGITSRVISLFVLGVILFYLRGHQSNQVLWLIFLFITLFALGGAFSNISYNDILGKSVSEHKRKTFFSSKQIIAGSIVLLSAVLAKKVLTSFGYPVNFAIMFFIGAALLLIASGGFWSIKEHAPSAMVIDGFKGFISVLRKELIQNKKLVYFLGFVNTQGIMISFLPFVMLYGKASLNTQASDTGSFLLFKVIGIVSISVLVLLVAKRIKYNPILYANVFLSLIMISISLFVKDAHFLRYIFILGGIIFSLYSITMNGLLLEVSGTENRALYAGFAGAGNILPALFALSGGWIIGHFGFRVFFLISMLIVSLSLFFIRKINCQK